MSNEYLHEYRCTRSDLPANARIPVASRHPHYLLARSPEEAVLILRERFRGENNFTVELAMENAYAFQVMTRKRIGF